MLPGQVSFLLCPAKRKEEGGKASVVGFPRASCLLALTQSHIHGQGHSPRLWIGKLASYYPLTSVSVNPPTPTTPTPTSSPKKVKWSKDICAALLSLSAESQNWRVGNICGSAHLVPQQKNKQRQEVGSKDAGSHASC